MKAENKLYSEALQSLNVPFQNTSNNQNKRNMNRNTGEKPSVIPQNSNKFQKYRTTHIQNKKQPFGKNGITYIRQNVRTSFLGKRHPTGDGGGRHHKPEVQSLLPQEEETIAKQFL